MSWFRGATSLRAHRSRRFSPSSAGSLGGGLLEGRALTAPCFLRQLNHLGLYDFGTYTKSAGAFVPDDTLGGAIYVYPGAYASTTPGTNSLTITGSGSFSGMSQAVQGAIMDGAIVPPYSTTTVPGVEFAASHYHGESGNSFGSPGGSLSVQTQATGLDSWEVHDWQDATVTVEFVIGAMVPSNYSYTQFDIAFQSTYFGFTLTGDTDGATLTLRDGDGTPTSTTSFLDSSGMGAATQIFTIPAVAQFAVNYTSTVYTVFDGSGMEPIQSSVEQQTIDWHVSFDLN